MPVSELVQSKVVLMLGGETQARLGNLLKSSPQGVANYLRKEYLPKGWSDENESDFRENMQPDSQEASEAATVDAENLDAAGATWARLSQSEKDKVLEAVKLLTPDSGAEKDLARSLEQSQSLDLPD